MLFLMFKIPVKDHATYALHENAQLHSNSRALKHRAVSNTVTTQVQSVMDTSTNTKPVTSHLQAYRGSGHTARTDYMNKL
ncbi:hypothetical protein I79_011788 [Cricetulus griseus]|uniref:Uncharacterized protein n=1 Tax=Cricetulus griseus TaxID=10029 RepID=G3HM40_CRIGR|nr:hypothetical protein I79_011788 [Cricetulus griseus]